MTYSLLHALCSLVATQSVFNDIDTGLARFQSSNGAFKSGDTVDAEATANGVFLYALFAPSGVRSLIVCC